MRKGESHAINAHVPWAVIGASGLRCHRCRATSHAPRTSVAVFNQIIETFYETHKHCTGSSS